MRHDPSFFQRRLTTFDVLRLSEIAFQICLSRKPIINGGTTYRGRRVSSRAYTTCLTLKYYYVLRYIFDIILIRDMYWLFSVALPRQLKSGIGGKETRRRDRNRRCHCETAAFPRPRHLRIVKYPP